MDLSSAEMNLRRCCDLRQRAVNPPAAVWLPHSTHQAGRIQCWGRQFLLGQRMRGVSWRGGCLLGQVLGSLLGLRLCIQLSPELLLAWPWGGLWQPSWLGHHRQPQRQQGEAHCAEDHKQTPPAEAGQQKGGQCEAHQVACRWAPSEEYMRPPASCLHESVSLQTLGLPLEYLQADTS